MKKTTLENMWFMHIFESVSVRFFVVLSESQPPQRVSVGKCSLLKLSERKD